MTDAGSERLVTGMSDATQRGPLVNHLARSAFECGENRRFGGSFQAGGAWKVTRRANSPWRLRLPSAPTRIYNVRLNF